MSATSFNAHNVSSPMARLMFFGWLNKLKIPCAHVFRVTGSSALRTNPNTIKAAMAPCSAILSSLPPTPLQDMLHKAAAQSCRIFLSLLELRAIKTGTAPSSIILARNLPRARLDMATMHRCLVA